MKQARQNARRRASFSTQIKEARQRHERSERAASVIATDGYCDRCFGVRRHRWDCQNIPDAQRAQALDEARFEGDIDDGEFYAERDRLTVKEQR